MSARFLLSAVVMGAISLGATVEGRTQSPPAVPQRITAPIDETALTSLPGNTHPLARQEFDQGAVADSQPLRRMLLLLKRSAAQETALKALLDQQQSESSPNYHQWLTPQQFGHQFGPADADVQTVTGWLQTHGFQVARVSAGRTVIEFSGNAGQVREAFRTEIHRYAVNGEEHFANSSDPQIPAALTPVVAGTVSLHNFPRKPQSHIAGLFSRDKSTGIVKPLKTANELRSGNAPSPNYSFASPLCPLNNTCYALGPTDFATIYNIPSNLDGSGQTIAIVGNSEICTMGSPDWGQRYVNPNGNLVSCGTDDIASFQTLFGLPANAPRIIVDGSDPGFTATETEGDLDVEWAAAIARNVTIDFVIAQDTETNAGVDLAAEYVVDNNLAPVLSESFGECEAFLGIVNTFYYYLWEQAAAQGITVVVAAGDSGSAGCDFPGVFAAQNGVGVNGIASTPFNVAAGGTDFDITAANYGSTYWNIGNISPTQQSARSYIPETTWDDSCAQSFTGSLKGCDSPTLLSLDVVGGGGGQSGCSVQAFSSGTCFAAYPKPAWQSGPYVPSMGITDVYRDLPDISFFAADGLISGSFYIVCEADLDPSDAPCSATSSTPFTTFIGVGGTSSSAPAFAGVMALVNQQETTLHGSNPTIPTRQGNANYVLYALANAQQKAGLNCDSSAGPALACTFNDVTRGNNSVPCYLSSTNCNATAPTPYGLLETTDSSGNLTDTMAFNAGSGYDWATGLGTINVTNLVNKWQSAVGKFTPTRTTLTMCAAAPNCTLGTGPITIVHGQFVDTKITVTPPSGSGTPSGNVVFVFTPSAGTLPQSALGTFTLSGGSVSPVLDWLPGGTYTVTAHYAGDGTFGASDSAPGISVTVTPESTTKITLTAPMLNFSNGTIAQTLATPAGGTVDFGDAVYLRVDITGVANQGNATGTVTFQDTTSTGTATLGTVALNAKGYAEFQTGADLFANPLTPLAVGAHSITAAYTGDQSYAGVKSATLPITVMAAPTTISIQVSTPFITPSNSITVSPNTSITLTAFVDTQSANNPSGGSFASTFQRGADIEGTVTFAIGNTTQNVYAQLSTAKLDSNGFIASSLFTYYTPTVAQNLTVSATFTPSCSRCITGNYLASATASPVTINVANNEGFTINPAGMNVDCSHGFGGPCIFIPTAGQSATSPITVTSIGLSGTVSLTCAVKPTNPADLQTPGCSFTLNGATNSTVNLTGSGSSGQRMLTITTTAHSRLRAPAIGPRDLDWMLFDTAMSLLACSFLLLNVRTRKLSVATVFLALCMIMGGVTAGCGGGSSGGNSSGTTTSGSNTSGTGGSGGSSTSSPGTTPDIYTVTVTATPSVGTAIQTQFLVFVQ